MLNIEVDDDLHNSDHFPLLVSHVNGAGTRLRPPIYHFHCADWDKFTRLAIITGTMVQNKAIDDAVLNVIEAIRNAADAAIPKTSNLTRKLCKPWLNSSCQKGTKEGVGCRKYKAANGLYREFTIPILETSTALYSSPFDVANVIGQTFASVSSSNSYSPAFQATKNHLERTPINFRCRQSLPYNCDFGMWELKRVLSSAHNTSPGPDGISYELIRHLNEDSLTSLYVDDLQTNCEGSDMRMIERQLQTAVNNIVKWCDTNGHSISASKSCCVHFCRKRGIPPDPEICIRDVQIPVVPDVLSNTSWGADQTSLLRVYQAIVLSRIDYGCVVYGSACNSTLKRLDPVHHMALRICSGVFRTLPVQSLYVNCNQFSLDLRRRKLSLAYYFKILSVPSHPLKNVYMSTSVKRIYDARPSNIRPFIDRMKRLITELDLPIVEIQQRDPLLFQPWNTPRFHYINPFASYSKSTVTPVIFQRVFAYHRSQYIRYSAIYTDSSKRADYGGCGVVIEDVTHGYRLDPSCSVFTAEAVAIYCALQSIDSNVPRKYCIYTDSMSVLEALENYNDRCHPVVCNVLDITSRLYSKGFDTVFCWLPSHVEVIGNEQADSTARSVTTHLPLAVPLSDIKCVILHHIFKIWQESWSQQLDNKLHSVKPVIGAWPVMPMRRTDVKLTRLCIGYTCFAHRHLLLRGNAPECPSCKKQGTQQLETGPGCEQTQEESIRIGPESVVANGAVIARERKTKLASPERGSNCDVNGYVYPNDIQNSRRSQRSIFLSL
ncbi:putative RNA-directed DNA polymerase from transposon X-element [Trichonephila clavipes]|nr:putative RNA-directed DNA polymerase from transposon X-element [Trichonephila clavipes]